MVENQKGTRRYEGGRGEFPFVWTQRCDDDLFLSFRHTLFLPSGQILSTSLFNFKNWSFFPFELGNQVNKHKFHGMYKDNSKTRLDTPAKSSERVDNGGCFPSLLDRFRVYGNEKGMCLQGCCRRVVSRQQMTFWWSNILVHECETNSKQHWSLNRIHHC